MAVAVAVVLKIDLERQQALPEMRFQVAHLQASYPILRISINPVHLVAYVEEDGGVGAAELEEVKPLRLSKLR